MARSRYCRVCKDWHDADQPWPELCFGHFGGLASPAPNVISDSMDGIRSMADGKMYDSKSRYRAELKAHGCIEVGNERQERRVEALPPVRDSLRQTMQQLSSRR